MSKNSNIAKLVIYFLGLFILSSCGIQRKTQYLQVKNNSKSEYTNNAAQQDYKLKPKDALFIQISSLDDATATISSNSSATNYPMDPYGASLLSHTIDKEGYLELPVIGKLNVKDKTIGEVTSIIKESLRNVLNQPMVSVKLVNRFVSVLGEVKTPGHFVFSEEKITIFDALGLAGDVTDYGNLKNVILVRNEQDINKRIELNLLSSEILSSPYYFLKPGDIIYVKARKSKFWGFREFPFGTILSAITTTVLVLSYTRNN